ncbi:hypothetical protein ACJBX3_10605, partial [Streptococcus suis]
MGQLHSGARPVDHLVPGANQLQAGVEQLARATRLSADQSSPLQAVVTGLPQVQAALHQLNDRR